MGLAACLGPSLYDCPRKKFGRVGLTTILGCFRIKMPRAGLLKRNCLSSFGAFFEGRVLSGLKSQAKSHLVNSTVLFTVLKTLTHIIKNLGNSRNEWTTNCHSTTGALMNASVRNSPRLMRDQFSMKRKLNPTDIPFVYTVSGSIRGRTAPSLLLDMPFFLCVTGQLSDTACTAQLSTLLQHLGLINKII